MSKKMGCEVFCLFKFKVCVIVVEEFSKKVFVYMVGIIFVFVGVVEIVFISLELKKL